MLQGFVVVDENNHTMFAVDPAEPSKILEVLKEEEAARKREFLGILTTHKHAYVRVGFQLCFTTVGSLTMVSYCSVATTRAAT